MNKKTLDINKIFGSRVKEARINKGFSQEKFAEMLGIGVSTLSKIECAKSYPTPDTMNKIINTLEIEPYLLFIDNNHIDSEKMYKSLMAKLKDLKTNEIKLKIAYDFLMQLK
ncbi:MAG: helix-turn-helix transcriptional regulator [Candidatus Gastranaerophilales bacterium]|nr:helix-turn-helix transcriptional regulator [Candidatus Gastranaerophilales bacterium]